MTYVNRTAEGRLLELPLSWYRDLNGWAMSPGYDTPGHYDMRREICSTCLFCHAAYPRRLRTGHAKEHRLRSLPWYTEGGASEETSKGHDSESSPAYPGAAEWRCPCSAMWKRCRKGSPILFRQPGRGVSPPGEPLSGYKLYFDRADAGTALR